MFGRFKNIINSAVDQITFVGAAIDGTEQLVPSTSQTASAIPSSKSMPNLDTDRRKGGSTRLDTRSGDDGPPLKFRYTRPYFLQLNTDDEIQVSADHSIRPIIVPRDLSKMPWNAGYAETINAGKSTRNEDEACIYRSTIRAVINENDLCMKVADMMPSVPAYPNQIPIGMNKSSRSDSIRARPKSINGASFSKQKTLAKPADAPSTSENSNGPPTMNDISLSESTEYLSLADDSSEATKIQSSASSDSLNMVSAQDLLSPTTPLPLDGEHSTDVPLDNSASNSLTDPLGVSSQNSSAKEAVSSAESATEARESSDTTPAVSPTEKDPKYETPPQSPHIFSSINSLKGSSKRGGRGVMMEESLPWIYFALFDGHAGSGVSVAASNTLHRIIHDKLQSISDLLIAFGLQELADQDKKKLAQNGNCDKEGYPSISRRQQSDDSLPNGDINDDELVTCNEVINGNSGTNSLFSHNLMDKISSKGSLVINQDAHLFGDNVGLLFCPAQDKIVTVDNLIIGALESAFWEMDKKIEEDKRVYRMNGGCTVLVSIFILGKLYVANAGDSRAIISRANGKQVIPMSFDFTPESERQRIKYLGLLRPEFCGKEFTHLEFVRRPMRRDLGKKLLYRDAFMTGWAYKTITVDDLKFPLIYGEGKRSRVLATIGVTRGFGDHELKAQATSLDIKPFLTPQPEVKVYELSFDSQELDENDVLIMGTDGLWDVISNQHAASVVARALEQFPASDECHGKYRFITAAQDLVMQARGKTRERNEKSTSGRGSGWRTFDNRPATIDDISVFVIPLRPYKEEFEKWRRARSLVRAGIDE